MEYNKYYEDYWTNMDQPPKKPKRKPGRAGAFIVTAVVFMVMGALLASILLPGNNNGLYSAQKTAAPSATPNIIAPLVSESPSALQTPVPAGTNNPMVELDGVLPVITSTQNPIPDIVESVSAGVVGVLNYGKSASGQGESTEVLQSSGSGFVISSAGYIVTNAHVIEDATRVTISFSDGTSADAEIVGKDIVSDLAVLKVSGKTLHPLKLGQSSSVRIGEFAIAIGDPTGRELAGTTTFGIVSATARTVNINGQTNTYIQTDAAINPGNSGGPLLSMSGAVIGITSAKTVTASYDEYGNAISAEGLGFALPIDGAQKVIAQLITQGHIKSPGIGISVIKIDDYYAKALSFPKGILIYTVTAGGPADQAGLKIDDVMLSCDGVALSETEAFVTYLQTKAIGDVIRLKYWRDGVERECDVTVGDLNTMGSELVQGKSKLDSLNLLG